MLVCDGIVLVSNASIHSVKGVLNFYRDWEEVCQVLGRPNTIKALILNTIDLRKKNSKDLLELVGNHRFLNDLAIPNYLKYYETIASAINARKSLSNNKMLMEKVGDPIGKIVRDLEKKGVL